MVCLKQRAQHQCCHLGSVDITVWAEIPSPQPLVIPSASNCSMKLAAKLFVGRLTRRGTTATNGLRQEDYHWSSRYGVVGISAARICVSWRQLEIDAPREGSKIDGIPLRTS